MPNRPASSNLLGPHWESWHISFLGTSIASPIGARRAYLLISQPPTYGREPVRGALLLGDIREDGRTCVSYGCIVRIGWQKAVCLSLPTVYLEEILREASEVYCLRPSSTRTLPKRRLNPTAYRHRWILFDCIPDPFYCTFVRLHRPD
ncbi:hypothetical protein K458DRAFT_154803 [Lentithecium fluviatile CBS 122367]|uniref:Uncharacterized protein n=1 Tax=Lentithecium fluviatile CBS 122367 TaxID=1168545 RepID=A0A6G1JEG0_9PLEO|nr:hypothetical protein K458DRAFT_154803 [Lentithecium fluviatile CBS 122367]